MKRILIVKMSSLGDIIHAFPVLHYLKQWNAQVKIDWVVEQPFAELVQAHPLVHHVMRVQTKKWRSRALKKETWQEVAHFRRELRQTSYDLVLDLQGNVKSGLVTASAKSALKVGFGYSSVPEWPNLLTTHKRYNPPSEKNIREDYLFLAQSAVGHFNSLSTAGVELNLIPYEYQQFQPVLEGIKQCQSLKVMICPGSNWPNKQLSKNTLLNFLHIFSQHFSVHFFFIWGNPAEKTLAEEVISALPQHSSLIPKLSLASLQNLMTHVDLVLAMDSLPLHLAGTTSTPTYSVFGASSAHKYKPIGKCHEAFQGSCPYGKTFEKRCTILRSCETGACIKHLEGQHLFDHFLKWWSVLRA